MCEGIKGFFVLKSNLRGFLTDFFDFLSLTIYVGYHLVMNILALVLTVIISSIIKLPAASATVYSYGDGNTVIGYIQTYKINDSESLIEIARKFGLGYNEIVDANPDLDPFVPGAGVSVKIPTLWILPDTSLNEGIVINLSEMRLYYFFKQKGERMVRTFPCIKAFIRKLPHPWNKQALGSRKKGHPWMHKAVSRGHIKAVQICSNWC